jgi:glutamate racemase
MGEDVTLVNSASESARELYRVLTEHDLLTSRTGPGEHRFLVTGDPEAFTRTSRRFLGNLFPNAAAAVLDKV